MSDLRRWWAEPPSVATAEVVRLTTGGLFVFESICGAVAASQLSAFDDVGVYVYLIAALGALSGVGMLSFGRRMPMLYWHINDELGLVLILIFALLGSRHGHGSVALVAPLLVYSLNTPFLFSLRAATFHLVQVFAGAIAVLVLTHVPLGEIILMEGNILAITVLGTWLIRQSDRAEEDPLTHLLNRRGFDRRLRMLVQTRESVDGSLVAAMFDIDHFKQINDLGGHERGDAVLRSCAQAWLPIVPTGAVLGRLGGDEFALLAPGISLREATALVERLRGLAPAGVTLSAGVAECQPGDGEFDLMRKADRALYQAKEAGRDQLVGFVPAV